MSIKRILVPLSGTSASSTLLQTAVEVAKLFEGHLEVLHLQPDLQRRLNEVAHGEGANLDESLIREVIEAAELDAERTRGAFEEIMRRHPISLGDDPSVHPAASWREASGGADLFAAEAGIVDLIVMARPNPDDRTASAFLDTALFTSGIPVLIAPPAAPARLPGRVLIGWNRTVQSERAIARAIPFLKKAQQIVLFAVETGAKRGPAAPQAARYLAWHGIRVAVKQVQTSERHVGGMLLQEASSCDADLLVMGAYSHSRLRQMILGGVTRYVLSNANLPVLMVH